MDIEPNSSMSMSGQSFGSQNNISNSNNPFFKLQHQNSYPQHPQMYYPPPPPMYYSPPNYMPPQQGHQPQGIFGNFIMNQLSNHMQGGSGKHIPQGYN
jgi:hypothetical protein